MNNIKKKNKSVNHKSAILNCRGFTLVEVLLYITISVTVLSAASFFLYSMLSMQVKSQAISEVEQQGIQVMQMMTQAIKNARGINSPTRGNTDATLSLDVIAPVLDPTVFGLSGGAINISEGGGASIDLTSPKVVASSLVFRNLSKSGTPGTVRIEFTLSHVNPSGRNEYEYSKTFYGSASVR